MINQNNIVGVYRSLEEQTRFRRGCIGERVGLLTTTNAALPFQFLVDGVVSEAELLSESGEVIAELEKAKFRQICTNKDDYCEYKGSELDTDYCGLAYIRLRIKGNDYYTELFDFRQLNTMRRDYYELSVSNENNMCGVLYQAGYKQSIIFEAFFDNPEPVVEREFSQTRTGGERLKYSRAKERKAFEFINILPYQLYLLSRLRDHDTVTMKRLRTGEMITLREIEFTSRTQDDCFLIGRISYLSEDCVVTGCGEDDVVIELKEPGEVE